MHVVKSCKLIAAQEIEDPFSLSGGRLPMVIEPSEAIVSWQKERKELIRTHKLRVLMEKGKPILRHFQWHRGAVARSIWGLPWINNDDYIGLPTWLSFTLVPGTLTSVKSNPPGPSWRWPAEVPEHGTATFTVTMTCMKATLTAANNYRYTLIGDCHWTHLVYISLHQFTFLHTFCLLHLPFPHLPLDLNIPEQRR